MSSTYHRAHGVENPGYVRLSNARTSFKGVEGALTVNDALALQAFAEELCLGKEESGALRYAEVGSYLGLSTQIVAHACPRALIFAHDLFPVNDGSSEYVLPRGEENENEPEKNEVDESKAKPLESIYTAILFAYLSMRH